VYAIGGGAVPFQGAATANIANILASVVCWSERQAEFLGAGHFPRNRIGEIMRSNAEDQDHSPIEAEARTQEKGAASHP
jgi:hypothetical protein